jgi:hypothetical protein
MGSTPLTLSLPAGVYRVGGAAGALHVPSFRVDLQNEDRPLVLDFALAAALRVHAGPGLALDGARRSEAIVRAGAWLTVDRIIAVSRVAEGDAHFLLGSIFDVRNGSLLREGSVRMIAGTVPAANLGALAAFLLTGQSSRDVKDRTDMARAAPGSAAALASSPSRPASPSPQDAARLAAASAELKRPPSSEAKPDRAAPDLTVTPRPLAPPLPGATAVGEPAARARRGWMRPAAYGSALLVGVFTGVAIHQGLAARQASSDAAAMLAPGGVLSPGSDPAHYRELRDDSRMASRNAYVSGGAAVAFAVAAGVLGWMSRTPAQPPALAFTF